MPLVTAKNLQAAFGDKALLSDANLEIEKGQRIGLIGRNGEGKSTLLRILNGNIIQDDGELQIQSGIRIAMLELPIRSTCNRPSTSSSSRIGRR